ncbi:hypothetical protein D6C95_08119, partial [Aureobasidium pullulans]
MAESTILIRTQDGMVQITYNAGETVGIYASDSNNDFGRDSAVLTLGRVDTTSSKAPDQVQYKHSYRNVEAEEIAEQYMGNIGIFPSGSMVGSHTYEDVKGKATAPPCMNVDRSLQEASKLPPLSQCPAADCIIRLRLGPDLLVVTHSNVDIKAIANPTVTDTHARGGHGHRILNPAATHNGRQMNGNDSGSNPFDRLPFAEQAAFNASDKQHDPLCLEHTRVEVLAEIRAWIYDRKDERCIFWLEGMARTGKSTIARTIARELHDSGHLGASFFFSRGGGDVRHAALFVTTVARQLAEHPNVDNKRILRASIIIVIDASDECDDENDIKSILQLFTQAQDITTVRLRVIVTIRPGTHSHLGLQVAPATFRRQLVLDELSKDAVDQDIRAFFKSHFDAIRIKHGALPTAWPGDDIVDMLVQRAGTLFIYAATVCRFLREDERFSQERLFFVLQQDSAYRKSLLAIDDIYIKVLHRAMANGHNKDFRTKLNRWLNNIIKPVVVLLQPLS